MKKLSQKVKYKVPRKKLRCRRMGQERYKRIYESLVFRNKEENEKGLVNI